MKLHSTIFWLAAFMAFYINTALAQHAVNFTTKVQVCLNEILPLNNISDPGNNVEWNFCATQLDGTYSSTSYGNLAGSITGLEIVEDNGTWYGFGVSRANALYRMNFGSDPFNPGYTITQLGNPGDLLDSPEGMSMMKDGNTWYGIVSNADGEIIRLTWTALNQPPAASSLDLAATGKFHSPSQVEIENDNGEFIAIVTNGPGTITTINFHASLANDPAASDVAESISFPGAAFMSGVTATRQCDHWEIYTIAASKIYRVVIPTLTTTITSGDINEFSSAFSFDLSAFQRIRSLKYYDRTYFYFTSYAGLYIKGASWKVGASAPDMVDMGTAVSPLPPYTFSVFQYSGSYGIYALGFDSGAINAIKLNSTCNSNERTSNEFSPRDIFYNEPAANKIGLNVTYSDGQTCSITQDILVDPSDAPDLDFSFTNVCENVVTTFSATSTETVTVNWDYGDGQSDATASHVYAAAGTYEATAEATASNSCTNRQYKNVKIYQPPVASFNIPSGLICTNNELTFTNSVNDVYDGLLTYQWSVDDIDVSDERDLKFTFASPGDKDVKLDVAIPGCSDDASQTLPGLLVGPTVGFTQTGKCEEDDIVFTNTSSGDISGYEWIFSDGHSSTATDVTHKFPAIGVYSVTLDATSTNGCVGSTTKDIPVYSTPQPGFSLDLPPFSCANTPSQFHDTTPLMSDSNIETWDWSFGDNGSGSGKNPLHTYSQAGPYTVQISVRTDKGCSNSAEQDITIQNSPTAAFDLSPSCVDQLTQLTDASAGDVLSWKWNIGTTVYNIQDPKHVFTSPGNYTVQLTVAASNACTNTLIKPVVVPVVPIVDFNVANACSGQPAVFTDITSGSADPVSQHNWRFNNADEDTGREVEHSFNDIGKYPVTLEVQTQSGCAYLTTKQVEIFQSPVASFTMSDEIGPPPLHVFFTNTSTGAESYLWNFNDGNPPSPAVSPDYTYSALGDYVVDLTATSTHACAATASKVVSVVVPRNELALEEFSLVPPSAGSAYRGYVRVRNNGNYRITSFVVNYYVGGAVGIKETITASLMPGVSGTFLLSNQFVNPGSSAYICVELDNDTDLSDNKGCTALGDLPAILSPYPNPADTDLTIETIHPGAGTARVRLYTMSGGVVYDKSFDVGGGLSTLSLDVRNLSPGVYVAVISVGEVATSQRIFISR